MMGVCARLASCAHVAAGVDADGVYVPVAGRLRGEKGTRDLVRPQSGRLVRVKDKGRA